MPTQRDGTDLTPAMRLLVPASSRCRPDFEAVSPWRVTPAVRRDHTPVRQRDGTPPTFAGSA